MSTSPPSDVSTWMWLRQTHTCAPACRTSTPGSSSTSKPKLPLRRGSQGGNVTIACSARARLDLTRYPAGTPEHEHANTVASPRQAETSPTTVQGNSSKSKALRIDRWRSWKVDSDPGGPEHVAKGS